ncbi:hypothetical protein BaRGS_00036660 [Batillaria attramentaria]|uniref:Secreted protein n=1 Tax=Batillaria attramentaria TaxID=370345 RepID=A0ABD0JBP8_9CAEN
MPPAPPVLRLEHVVFLRALSEAPCLAGCLLHAERADRFFISLLRQSEDSQGASRVHRAVLCRVQRADSQGATRTCGTPCSVFRVSSPRWRRRGVVNRFRGGDPRTRLTTGHCQSQIPRRAESTRRQGEVWRRHCFFAPRTVWLIS